MVAFIKIRLSLTALVGFFCLQGEKSNSKNQFKLAEVAKIHAIWPDDKLASRQSIVPISRFRIAVSFSGNCGVTRSQPGCTPELNWMLLAAAVK